VKTTDGSVIKMTKAIKDKILTEVTDWAVSETLRCLGLAQTDEHIAIEDMVLNDSSKFESYEVMHPMNVCRPC